MEVHRIESFLGWGWQRIRAEGHEVLRRQDMMRAGAFGLILGIILYFSRVFFVTNN